MGRKSILGPPRGHGDGILTLGELPLSREGADLPFSVWVGLSFGCGPSRFRWSFGAPTALRLPTDCGSKARGLIARGGWIWIHPIGYPILPLAPTENLGWILENKIMFWWYSGVTFQFIFGFILAVFGLRKTVLRTVIPVIGHVDIRHTWWVGIA